MALDNIINLENVTISHPENIIFKDISLKINKGDFTYIIGKTGSGKSTLLKSLYAEVSITGTKAYISGYNLLKIKKRQIPFLRRKLGIVFQDFQLLIDRSVFENLAFVLKATGWKKRSEIENRIHEVLDKVGLNYKEYKMPHELSGGEQQRVVIARALLNNPEIILADEPTGNLDPETSAGIIELLIDISKNGRAVLVATHDYPLLKLFPAKVIKCEDSKLIDTNSQEDIIDFNELF
jgi:cell division transport system ATP-binding protein